MPTLQSPSLALQMESGGSWWAVTSLIPSLNSTLLWTPCIGVIHKRIFKLHSCLLESTLFFKFYFLNFILIRYSDSWKKKRNLLNKKPWWRESLPSRTVHEGSRDDEHDCASCKRSREAHQTVHRNVRMLPVVRTCYHRKYFARLYFRGNSLRVMLECVDKLLGGIWFSLSTQLRRLTWETKIFSHCKLGMKAHLSDVAHQGGWPNSKQSEDRSTKSASFRWW